MAKQIEKKWISDGAIDGSKIKLLEGQSLVIEVAGQPVELLKLNENGNASLPQGEVPNIDYVDQSISDLQQLIEEDITNRIAAVEGEIDQEILDRQAGDSNLQSQINTEKGRVDGLESALAQEIVDRQDADASTLSSANSYTDQKITDLVNGADAALDTLKELGDALQDNEDAVAGIINQLSALDSELDQEKLDRANADSALSTRVTALETFGYDQVVYVSKNGSDTNTGKQHSPFLTITAAQNAITDASPTKRYAIKVMPGNYTEASLALKANVFIVGEGNKESVRITGPVSMDSSFSGTGDHRSGFHRVTLLSAADFNWATVTSGAGKLYFSETVFGSTLNMYGHNNAIAQTQFNSCVIFGAFTVSGINVGVFTDNICFSNITLNQHPNGGMVTTISATGGYCGGTFRLNSTANDFNRRSSAFLRDFWSENLISDGPVSYADVDLTSGSKQGAQKLNGGQVIALNPKISHDLETQMIKPLNTNAHNMGDWGKQWFWNFGYVHASTGTDLFLISYPENYAPDSSGKSIGIYTDGAGLQENVDGGEIVLETAATTGSGVRGKVILNGREIDVTSKKVTNLANGTDATDAVNKGQLDSAISAIPVIIFEKENKTVDATIISDTYWDLAFEAKPNSVHLFVERIPLIEDYDYSVSVVDGKTRITFLAPMLVPSEEALEVGDELHVKYAR